ncbi:CAS protein [Pelomyxa schiedti]|nr:CAS protein [Pelomyxa schiedti]
MQGEQLRVLVEVSAGLRVDASLPRRDAEAHLLSVLGIPTGSSDASAAPSPSACSCSAAVVADLLAIVGSQEQCGASAAVLFRNFISRSNWHACLSQDERYALITNVVGLVLTLSDFTHHSQLKQLRAALSLMAKRERPTTWGLLLPALIEKFTDFSSIRGIQGSLTIVLALGSRFFSDPLSDSELRAQMQQFSSFVAPPLLALLNNLTPSLGNPSNDLIQCLKLAIKLHHKILMCDVTDLPIPQWCGSIIKCLEWNPPPSETLEPAGIAKLKENCCKCCLSYLVLPRQVGSPLCSCLLTTFLDLFTSLTTRQYHDNIFILTCKFWSAVFRSPEIKSLYTPELHSKLCVSVVRNSPLCETELQILEEDPEEFIRRDMEGYDSHTRRRKLLELIQSLCGYNEKATTELLMHSLNNSLQNQPAETIWITKEAAVFVFISMSIKGMSPAHFVKVNRNSPIDSFFSSFILPEIAAASSTVVVASCLKFLDFFYPFVAPKLSPESEQSLCMTIIGLLRSPNGVIQAYSSIALSHIFLRLAQQIRNDISSPALVNLIGALNSPCSRAQAMKALMKALMSLDSITREIASLLIESLSSVCKLMLQIGVPIEFTHHFFEATARVTCLISTDTLLMSLLETKVLNLIVYFISSHTDFIGYILQLFTVVATQSATTPTVCANLLPKTTGSLLGNEGLSIPLNQFLCACIRKSVDVGSCLDDILRFFQQLIRRKYLLPEAFSLLNNLLMFLDLPKCYNHLRQCVVSLQPLKQSATLHDLTVFFFSLFVLKYDPPTITSFFEGVQPGSFLQNIDLLLKRAPYLMNEERSAAATAATKIVCSFPNLFSPSISTLWCQLVMLIIQLLQTPPWVNEEDDDGEEAVDDEDLAFAQLKCALPDESKPSVRFIGALDPKQYFLRCITSLIQSQPQVKSYTVLADWLSQNAHYL